MKGTNSSVYQFGLKLILIFCLWVKVLVLPADTFTFRNISSVDGLPDLTVSTIYKDSKGYLWLGTATSVERFDGVRFKHFPVYGNNEKLKWVNVITETGGNQLWVGTETGLWRVGVEKLEPAYRDSIQGIVREILSDEKGNLYIGSGDGVWIRKTDEKLERVILDERTLSPDNAVVAMCREKNGALWVFTKREMYWVSPDRKQKKHYPNPLMNDKEPCTYRGVVSIDDKLYIATLGKGLFCFDKQSETFSSFVDVGCNLINKLSTDGKDLLYLSTDGEGVAFVSVKQKKVVRTFRNDPSHGESLHSNSVYSLLLDRDGWLWVGFYQQGLDVTNYNSGAFSVYDYPPYFDSRNLSIRSICISGKEKLIGTRSGGYYVDEARGRYRFFAKPEIRSSLILCCEKFGDEYYIGTYGGGLYKFHPETMTLSDFVPSEGEGPFSNDNISCMAEDSERHIWFCTSSGLYCYDKQGKQLKHYTTENSSLPSNSVFYILFDSSGKAWICTNNGLAIWEPSDGRIRTDVFPEGFIHKQRISSIYEDSEQQLYFVPDKGELFVSDLQMTSFRYWSPSSLLFEKNLSFVVEDKDKWLWIGTNDGLYRYDKKEVFIPYSFADGVPNPIFFTCIPEIDEQGVIWFGNSKGLISLRKDWRMRENKNTYRVGISGVLLEGEEQDKALEETFPGQYRVALSCWRRHLTLLFSDFTYTDVPHTFYEYQWDDNGEWQRLEGKSELVFYDLLPGSYKLKIRRMGEPDSASVLTVDISMPMGYRLLFGGIALMLLVLAAIGYYLVKIRQRATAAETGVRKPLTEGEEPEEEKKEKHISLTQEECDQLLVKVRSCMEIQKLYINPDLKIGQLSDKTGVSVYLLSYLFNHYLNSSYYDFVNSYRIEEFNRLLEKGEHTQYTLQALIEKCGFSSRTSFFRYFKKVNGMSPGEYIRKFDEKK